MKLRIILMSFLCMQRFLSYSQQPFKLDEQKILNNENLDYFVSCLKTEKFREIKGKEDIPRFIKKQLPWISDGEIANKTEPFQATDVVSDKTLPWRQLIYAGRNDHLFVLTYRKGGIGLNYKILLVRFSKDKVTDVWIGTTFCKLLTSADAILNCITQNRNSKWGLNTNFVDK